MPITFTLVKVLRQPGQEDIAVRFTRETLGPYGKLYDIDVHPDGLERYAINCLLVGELPNLSSTRELHEVVILHKPLALALLSHNGQDTPESREAWWALKRAMM